MGASAVTTLLDDLKKDVAAAEQSVAATVNTQVDILRNDAGNDVAQLGVGAAAVIAPPGNKFQVIESVARDWRMWALCALGIGGLVFLFAHRARTR